MSNPSSCPICDYPLDANAVKVTVNEVAYRVCCEECAKEAAGNPSRLLAKV